MGLDPVGEYVSASCLFFEGGSCCRFKLCKKLRACTAFGDVDCAGVIHRHKGSGLGEPDRGGQVGNGIAPLEDDVSAPIKCR